MKLYTEEQVREMLFDLGDVLFNNNQNGIEEGEPAKHFDYVIEEYNAIKLPSDEEIEDSKFPLNSPEQELYNDGWEQGAKWMRNKIQGGKK